jgi:hypothetical protein
MRLPDSGKRHRQVNGKTTSDLAFNFVVVPSWEAIPTEKKPM